MKAAIVARAGQTPIYGDFVEPDAQPGEMCITVTAAALSPLTRARAAGAHYSAYSVYPFVAGVDGVGRTDDGRRVYFMLPRAPFGALAERSVVAAGQCVALPDALDDTTAAVIANPGMSSWAALIERARLRPGETVLVNGATGAAGRLAVRIARHLGAAKVIATGRDVAMLAAVGADVTIALNQPDEALADAFREQFATSVDIVLDYLWGASARSLLIAGARDRAAGVPLRFVQIGAAVDGDRLARGHPARIGDRADGERAGQRAVRSPHRGDCCGHAGGDPGGARPATPHATACRGRGRLERGRWRPPDRLRAQPALIDRKTLPKQPKALSRRAAWAIEAGSFILIPSHHRSGFS